MSDSINRPSHYNAAAIEVIDIIEAWKLGFHDGNVVKYVLRAPYKGRELEDLRKARWYLDRKIGMLEKKAASNGISEDKESATEA